MTNKELIKRLSAFPEDSEVNFCVFSNLTSRRCDVKDNHIMIKRSPHNGLIFIMLDLEPNWEEDIKAAGAVLATDCVMANDAPDEDALAACKALGEALV